MTNVTRSDVTPRPARRKGDHILCGHPGCGDILAVVPGDVEPIAGRVYLCFRSYYEPLDGPTFAADTLWSRDHPQEAAAHPPVTVLRFGGYALARLRRGETPRRRFHVGMYDGPAEAAEAADRVTQLVTMEDGTTMETMAYALPVVVPCQHRHLSRLDNLPQEE